MNTYKISLVEKKSAFHRIINRIVDICIVDACIEMIFFSFSSLRSRKTNKATRNNKKH